MYVAPSGLITVLLRHEVAVEMTLDRSIRVVNHRHQSVAATNNRGNSSCIYHACAKVYQERTCTDVEVSGLLTGTCSKIATKIDSTV